MDQVDPSTPVGAEQVGAGEEGGADEEEDRGQGQSPALDLRGPAVGHPAADQHARDAAEDDEQAEQRLALALGEVEVALVVLRAASGQAR